jgi:predicted hydrocarbon binding protein
MAKLDKFDWNKIGNLEEGRPSLGTDMPIAVYRLMQYTVMEELYELFSPEEAEDVFRRAGFRAGEAFAYNLLDLEQSLSSFVTQLVDTLKTLKMGILRIEKADVDNFKFVLTVDEDLDCSGLPIYGDTVCYYDEGFISGVMTTYTKTPLSAKEIDCWSTGARTCRFEVYPESE